LLTQEASLIQLTDSAMQGEEASLGAGQAEFQTFDARNKQQIIYYR